MADYLLGGIYIYFDCRDFADATPHGEIVIDNVTVYGDHYRFSSKPPIKIYADSNITITNSRFVSYTTDQDSTFNLIDVSSTSFCPSLDARTRHFNLTNLYFSNWFAPAGYNFKVLFIFTHDNTHPFWNY